LINLPLSSSKLIIIFIFRDNVEWDEAQETEALSQVGVHMKSKMPSEKAADLENHADEYWNKFYSVHQEKYVLLI